MRERDSIDDPARLEVPGPAHVGEPLAPGVHPLAVGDPRQAQIYVPASADPSERAKVVVSFHGAGGHSSDAVNLLAEDADRYGFVIVAPSSTGSTWDVIEGRRFGPDVAVTQAALDEAARHLTLDPSEIVLAGFSDGASYALSLGLANGDRVRAVLAFSPGFATARTARGKPELFISHGIADRVLPIDRTSRPLVKGLEPTHDVTYFEFAGGHEVPNEARVRALELLGWR